jgi:hypothetical protein
MQRCENQPAQSLYDGHTSKMVDEGGAAIPEITFRYGGLTPKQKEREKTDERIFESSNCPRCRIARGDRCWRNACACGKRRRVLPQGCHRAYDELRL